jgi:hypothetical protein
MGVKGAAAFNFDDTDTLNKWVRFIERAGEREPNPLPMDEKRRIVRAFMLNPLELDGVRMTIELSSRSMLRMELTKEEKTAFYAEGKYSRWDTVMPFKSASGEIYRNPKAFYRAQLLPVESELFSKILSRRIVISDGVIDRIYNDEDDEFTYPPHITQRAFGEREVIVPEGIGGAFIRKIVVRDDLYPEVARRAQETGLKIGGRDWRDVIVKASDDGKSGWAAEVSNVGNELEEFRER